jgi:hypothetical protein
MKGDGRLKPRSVVDAAFAEIDRLSTFVGMTRTGIHQACEAVEWVEVKREMAKAIRKPDPFPTEDSYNRAKGKAQKEQSLALEEKEAGFSYLNSLAVIRLWSIVESVVDDEAIAIIHTIDKQNPPESLKKLKGAIIPFVQLNANEQSEQILAILKDTLSSPLKRGVGGFELILDALGYGGSTDADVKKVLFECSQVRNAIIHRGGIADRKLKDSCPWLGVVLGAPIKVSGEDFSLYSLAAVAYVLEIEIRVTKEIRSLSKAEEHEKVRASLRAAITGHLHKRSNWNQVGD